MVDLLTTDDLAPFAEIEEEKATAMIADAVALAVLNAPCLDDDDLTPAQIASAKAILRKAVLRWNDAGSGAAASQTMGPFGAMIDTRQPSSATLRPPEIAELQKICRGETSGGVYAVDTAAQPMLVHQRFGEAFDDPFGVFGDNDVSGA